MKGKTRDSKDIEKSTDTAMEFKKDEQETLVRSKDAEAKVVLGTVHKRQSNRQIHSGYHWGKAVTVAERTPQSTEKSWEVSSSRHLS